jgi:hypothetical protein
MKNMWKSFWSQPTTPEEKRNAWYCKLCSWAGVHVSLGILSVLFPAVAAAVGGTVGSGFSVAATVTAGIIAFLGSQDQKDKYNVAWILLDDALRSKDENKIRDAELRGESIINAGALQKYAPDHYLGPPNPTP